MAERFVKLNRTHAGRQFQQCDDGKNNKSSFEDLLRQRHVPVNVAIVISLLRFHGRPGKSASMIR